MNDWQKKFAEEQKAPFQVPGVDITKQDVQNPYLTPHTMPTPKTPLPELPNKDGKFSQMFSDLWNYNVNLHTYLKEREEANLPRQGASRDVIEREEALAKFDLITDEAITTAKHEALREVDEKVDATIEILNLYNSDGHLPYAVYPRLHDMISDLTHLESELNSGSESKLDDEDLPENVLLVDRE
jgi:hypothetical protein